MAKWIFAGILIWLLLLAAAPVPALGGITPDIPGMLWDGGLLSNLVGLAVVAGALLLVGIVLFCVIGGALLTILGLPLLLLAALVLSPILIPFLLLFAILGILLKGLALVFA